ncbi:MAG: pyruvate dehydrogenase complex dihydrolipoamide acetyltransferase [Hyphomicrobiaceae bacterium]
MPTPILMPALSPTMEEGKLAKWLVKEGDKVTAGKVIAEIETDKATMEVEAVDEGTVGRILVPAGTEGVKVNTPVALLLEEGESADRLDEARPAASRSGGSAGAREPAAASSASTDRAVAGGALAGATAGGASAAVNGRGSSDGARIFSSPLARRLAREAGIDLSALKGSGPHGRIVKSDVEAAARSGGGARAAGPALAAPSGAAALATAPAAAAAGGVSVQPMPDNRIMAYYEPGTYEVLPHDGMRKTIARRLVESKVTIPHFYLSIECRLDELMKARERLNAKAPKEGIASYKLSVNDFIIKALALALRDVPAANATWTEAGMLRHKRIDVGVAVAVEGGLYTPVIRHADLKTLSEISNEMRHLAQRARDRKLQPHEYQGGTTSISNLGMYGIKRFDAVINPPHATILAVGAAEERAVVKDGAVEVANMMSCTLSCDHRVVDGALGANLLAAFKAYIEDPVRMLV